MTTSSDLAARIVAHYRKHASAWDADRSRALWTDRPWHERFAAALPEGGSVLDLGCGGGDPVARFLAERGLRVVGADTSPELLALFRARLPGAETHCADMRGLDLGRRFDGVLAWDSFFHLSRSDQRAMFAVFARHAAPGGVLMFNAGPAAGEAIGQYRGDPLFHASLAPEDYRDLLEQRGFSILHHASEDPAAGGRTAWLALANSRAGPTQ